MPKAIPIKEEIGKRYGRLTVVSFINISVNKQGQNHPVYSCLCDCGKRIEVKKVNLRRTTKPVRSCGCLHVDTASVQGKANATHGLSKSRLYSTWRGIIDRCENRNSHFFHRYGGRGITVYPAWRNDFESFRIFVGERPSDAYSIDRIDNNGNYEPGNIRWADKITQANNRDVKIISLAGLSISLPAWCRYLGVEYKRVHHRMHVLKWSFEKSISTPFKVKK